MSGFTGAGWCVLAGGVVLAGAGMALGYPTLTGLGFAAGAALCAAVLVTRLRPQVGVERRLLPDRVSVGQPAAVVLDLRNPGALPSPGLDVVQHVAGHPHRLRMPPLGGKETYRLHLPIATVARGLLRLDPLELRQHDPFGLMRRTAVHCGQGWLWVRPRVLPMRALPLGVVPDFEGAEHRRKGTTALASLREYVPGDDIRHIHWKSTARVGALVVREHLDTTEPAVAMVIDTRRAVLAPALFEEAVTFAASLAVASGRLGQEVVLAAAGEDRETVERLGGHHVLDRLAALSQQDGGEAGALIRLAGQLRPGGSLVVLSGAESGLLPLLVPLRRRFSRAIAIFLGTSKGSTRTMRRNGLVIVHADSARDAARAWSQQVGSGGPA